MADRLDDDARLQRLADLSIEIRMLKARVQAAMDEHSRGEPPGPVSDARVLTFRTPLGGASCPYCGHTAGLALLPREYRRPSTLVRCFGCQRDASAFDWVVATPQTKTRSASGQVAG